MLVTNHLFRSEHKRNMGEVEKKTLSALHSYWVVPLRGYRKKKLAWNEFKKTYWKVKLGQLSYKLNHAFQIELHF